MLYSLFCLPRVPIICFAQHALDNNDHDEQVVAESSSGRGVAAYTEPILLGALIA